MAAKNTACSLSIESFSLSAAVARVSDWVEEASCWEFDQYVDLLNTACWLEAQCAEAARLAQMLRDMNDTLNRSS